jgi:hypothetical protein
MDLFGDYKLIDLASDESGANIRLHRYLTFKFIARGLFHRNESHLKLSLVYSLKEIHSDASFLQVLLKNFVFEE